jgi:hypothetical protein
VPRIADGTLVSAEAYKAMFPGVPGLKPPAGPLMPPRLDFGPRFGQGIADKVPPARGEPYVTGVPAPDANGNDRSGVRQVELEAPLGTHTGWNLRSPETGFPTIQGRFDGSFVPFPRSEAERVARADPRPSIEARYPSKKAFMARVHVHLSRQAKAGFLLAEDVDAVAEEQSARYDRVMAHEPEDQTCNYLFAK